MVVSAPTALAPRRHRGRHGNWQDARTARAPQRRPDLQNPIRQCKCSRLASRVGNRKRHRSQRARRQGGSQ
eukprot:scaffold61895_cov36-Phaeocystis_antarctica.AAC.1